MHRRRRKLWSLLVVLALLGAGATLTITSDPAQAAGELDMVKARIHEMGSGDWMRQHFSKDLEPIGLTPGGAGMLVVLYSKKADLSIAFCTDFDVILGVKPGKVMEGWKCGADSCRE
jgi:hypothetical protein